MRENEKRAHHDYDVVHYAYILMGTNYQKLEGEKLGPFRITEMHNIAWSEFKEKFSTEILISDVKPHTF